MFSERYKNYGLDCWNGCSSKQGQCAWCGTEGMCCRIGWTGNGCDGNMGIKDLGHVCVEKRYCTTTLCKEGEGDCSMDSECEGSLACGQMNCANSTLQNCCTKTCNYDSDCTSGECNAEHNQCRLNSDTVDWSKCSQDSPCADGEGDCDHHTDCQGTLLCRNDNCASGPTGMDCCTDDGN